MNSHYLRNHSLEHRTGAQISLLTRCPLSDAPPTVSSGALGVSAACRANNTGLMGCRILVIQHGADDPPGRVGDWLLEAGCDLEVVRGYAGDTLPADLGTFAGLVVLGGEMNAYDDDGYPWLTATKTLLREAVRRRAADPGHLPGPPVARRRHRRRGGAGGRRPAGRVPHGLRPLRRRPPIRSSRRCARAAHPSSGITTSSPCSPRRRWCWPARRPGSRFSGSAPAPGGSQSHPEVDLDTVRRWAADEVDRGLLSADVADRWLSEISVLEPNLIATWRPVTERFARLVTGSAPTPSEPAD